MRTVTPETFRVHPLSTALLEVVRASGLDASGHPAVEVLAEGGEPLRCCLRDAVAGEALILFGYEPVLPASPYREIGAVFAHSVTCAGADPDGGYPPAWRGRPQVLRGYDERGWIVDARVHDGGCPEASIEQMLADDRVTRIHSRNVAYGCFMFVVTRPSVPDSVPEAAPGAAAERP